MNKRKDRRRFAKTAKRTKWMNSPMAAMARGGRRL
jgi:hypothetical protein